MSNIWPSYSSEVCHIIILTFQLEDLVSWSYTILLMIVKMIYIKSSGSHSSSKKEEEEEEEEEDDDISHLYLVPAY